MSVGKTGKKVWRLFETRSYNLGLGILAADEWRSKIYRFKSFLKVQKIIKCFTALLANFTSFFNSIVFQLIKFCFIDLKSCTQVHDMFFDASAEC